MKEAILKNIKELIDDADLLAENRRYKRASFCILTAFEEIEKLKLSHENTKLANTYSHKMKLKPLDDVFKLLSASVLNLARKEMEKNNYDKQTKDYVEMFLNTNLTFFDPMKMRNACLYIDKEFFENQAFYSNDNMSVFYKSFKTFVENELKNIRSN